MKSESSKNIADCEINDDGVCLMNKQQMCEIINTRTIEKLLKDGFANDKRELILKVKMTSSQEMGKTFIVGVENTKKKLSKTLYVKLSPKWEKFNPAPIQYETLKFLQTQMNDVFDLYGSAKPFDYYEDINAFSQESVGNQNLKDYLLKKNSRFKNDTYKSELSDILRKSGGWIATFHNITNNKDNYIFDTNDFLKSIESDFSPELLNKFKFKQDTLSKLSKTFELMQKVNGIELPCAKWHYDYTLAHIYFDKKKIYVIDILGLDGVNIFEDIGHFLASLSAVNYLPFYPNFDYKYATTVLCAKFIEGYAEQTQYDINLDLMANIYKLKHLVLWFGAQYLRATDKTIKMVGKVYANYHLVPIYEYFFGTTINDINRMLK